MLAQSGATLILNGFGDVDAAKDAVAQYGKTPCYHGADLSDEAQIADMMRYAESEFGGVDILVNNAGIQHVSPVETFPVDKWNAIIAINLSSVFTPRVWRFPGMRARNWGASLISLLFTARWPQREICLRSGEARRGGIHQDHRTGNRADGCHLQCAVSRLVLTPLVQQQIDKRIAEGAEPEAARDALLSEKQPSREFVTPEQLGELALFLCSDGAAQVRGVAWNMDGGWVAQ